MGRSRESIILSVNPLYFWINNQTIQQRNVSLWLPFAIDFISVLFPMHVTASQCTCISKKNQKKMDFVVCFLSLFDLIQSKIYQKYK